MLLLANKCLLNKENKIISNEKKNSILEFIEENYPTNIQSSWEKGCAYACDKIKDLLDEDNAMDKILDFIKNSRQNFTDCVYFYTDFEDGCAYVYDEVSEILDREEGSIMIKHMKAPKECSKCLFCKNKENNDYGWFGECMILNDKRINLLSHDKLNDCPIVEVEHSDD